MRIRAVLIFSLLLPVFFTGCFAGRMHSSADKEVYKIIDEKTGQASGDFLPRHLRLDEIDEEPLEISLKEAMVLAAENNRAYRSRREDVYLNVLDLTYRRYRFGTRYSAGAAAGWDRDAEGEETLSGRFNVRLLRWLSTGAEITIDITQDFLRYLTGESDRDLRSIISLNIMQPLLRGAGREIVQEGLVQAERDAVYAIRSFLRYQKDFSVDLTDRYLGLLLLNSRKDNFYNNYESLKRTRQRIEMLAEAGRLPSLQVDQARQNEFNAYQRWITSVNRYEAAIDNFKIHLGLSPDTRVVLDETMLDYFIRAGIEELEIDFDEFADRALSRRLDLITQYDRLKDAYRKAGVAENQLKAGLNLRIGSRSATEKDSSLNLNFGNPSYSAGLELELPVDRFSERNQYVMALVNIDRMEREFENKLDSVKLEITQQYRNLQEAYQSYIIQKNSLELASQRIESIGLLLQAGRATTRDLLEAEESYLSAQNDLASEMVNHTMAYLRFLYSSEYLEVDEAGLWRGDVYEKVIKKGL